MLMALDSPDARPDLTDWISCSGPLGPPGPENGSMTHSAHIADTPRHTRPEADLNKVQSCLLCAWHFCVLIKEINTHICKARHWFFPYTIHCITTNNTSKSCLNWFFVGLIATSLHCTKPWGSLRDRLVSGPWCPCLSGLRLNGILLSGLVNVKCNYTRIGHVLICLCTDTSRCPTVWWSSLQSEYYTPLWRTCSGQGVIIISNWAPYFNDDKTLG